MAPNMTGIGWVDWLIIVGTAGTALTIIYRKVLKPVGEWTVQIVHAFDIAADVMPALPILLTIANEFKPNGGHSLKDGIDRIEGQLTTTIATQGSMGAKLDTLHTYAHDARHDQLNQIQKLALADEIISTQLQDLARQVAPMPDQLDSIAAHAAANAAADRSEHPPAAPDA